MNQFSQQNTHLKNSFFAEQLVGCSYFSGKLKPCICNTSLPRALQNLVIINQWMIFIKDRANVSKTRTCGKRLKAGRVLFWLVLKLLSNSLIHRSFLCFQSKKQIRNHQSKTVLLFKTYTLEFEFHWHLEHMGHFLILNKMEDLLPWQQIDHWFSDL